MVSSFKTGGEYSCRWSRRENIPSGESFIFFFTKYVRKSCAFAKYSPHGQQESPLCQECGLTFPLRERLFLPQSYPSSFFVVCAPVRRTGANRWNGSSFHGRKTPLGQARCMFSARAGNADFPREGNFAADAVGKPFGTAIHGGSYGASNRHAEPGRP